MNIKFEECNYPLIRQGLEDIVKKAKTNYIFLLIEEIEEKRDYTTYKLKKIKHQKIVTLEYHPNVIILNHDVFYGTMHDEIKERIIGYCPLIFEEKYQNIIRI